MASLRDVIKNNREFIDCCIRSACGKIYPLNDEERRLWILNDEGLYLWAKSKGWRG